jgi:hypothetical protein
MKMNMQRNMVIAHIIYCPKTNILGISTELINFQQKGLDNPILIFQNFAS